MKFKMTAVVITTSILAACNQTDSTKTQSVQPEKKAAAEITEQMPISKSGVTLDNFDKSVRPQDDFYRYVNGSWLAKTEIPADRSNYGSFSVLADQARENLRLIIEESAANNNLEQGTDEQKVGDLYNSVLDVETLDKRGVSPLKPYLDEINSISNNKELVEYFAQVAKVGAVAPIGFFVNNDSKNPTEYILYLSQSGLGLPNRDYYFDESETNEKVRVEYVQHIERMFELAGLSNGKSAAQDIMALETAIANSHWDKVKNRDRNQTYNKMSLKEVSELGKTFDWKSYFAALGLSEQSHVIVRQPSYISEFDRAFTGTPLESWKSYLTWGLIRSNAAMLSTTMDEANFDFFGRTLQGTPSQLPRWKRGVDAVNGLLGEVVGKVYVAKHFKPEAKERMQVLVENLRKAYHESILKLDWMGDATKKQAIDKLNKFRAKIGYPDKWRDYSALTIQSGKLFENYMAAREFNWQYNLNKLGNPINRDEWFMTPQTVNAYYNPVMNEIVFPAAILQPPFFDMDADDAVNYGGIGAVIGHEMGHGFDDQGSKSDGDGVLRNWWTESDLKSFKERTQALVTQYDAFEPIENETVSGAFTLGENIGDLGGLTIAYAAYQLANGDSAPEDLDGFTGNQRFFIGWAQVWARKYREEEMRRRLKTDPHSPSEYRTNGVVRNMPEFVEAFSLKQGDALFLPVEKRVKIW